MTGDGVATGGKTGDADCGGTGGLDGNGELRVGRGNQSVVDVNAGLVLGGPLSMTVTVVVTVGSVLTATGVVGSMEGVGWVVGVATGGTSTVETKVMMDVDVAMDTMVDVTNEKLVRTMVATDVDVDVSTDVEVENTVLTTVLMVVATAVLEMVVVSVCHTILDDVTVVVTVVVAVVVVVDVRAPVPLPLPPGAAPPLLLPSHAPNAGLQPAPQ